MGGIMDLFGKLFGGNKPKKLSPEEQAEENRRRYLELSNTVSGNPILPDGGKTHKITGTSHYQANIKKLGTLNPKYTESKDEIVRNGWQGVTIWKYSFPTDGVELVPEPENPHDPNAVKVLVHGVLVGYIKAGSCTRVLKLIRDGSIKSIRCRIIGGQSVSVYADSDPDTGKTIYSLEKSSGDYRVDIAIYC